jgi:hypothetical protein
MKSQALRFQNIEGHNNIIVINNLIAHRFLSLIDIYKIPAVQRAALNRIAILFSKISIQISPLIQKKFKHFHYYHDDVPRQALEAISRSRHYNLIDTPTEILLPNPGLLSSYKERLPLQSILLFQCRSKDQ